MALFYGMQRLESPEDWKDLAGSNKWQPTRSAYELAYAWQGAGGIPADIATGLERSGQLALAGLRLEIALVEKPVFLDTLKAPSMTDIMAYARNGSGEPVVMAVEGKVTETFDIPVRDWLRGGVGKGTADVSVRPTRARRLQFLADRLGVTIDHDSALYYQLLHRTVSALTEAELHGAVAAVLLIHSFAPGDITNWQAYQAFIGALGGAAPAKQVVSGPIRLQPTDIPLFAMWWESAPVEA